MCGSSLPLPARVATDFFTGGAGEAIGALGGTAPDAPNLPQYPGLTPEEMQILKQQQSTSSQMNSVVSGVSGQLGQNQNILQMISGLFNSDGTINQNAVSQLQKQTTASTGAAGAAGTAALQGLGGTQSALGATQAQYMNALNGNAPANQQMQYQQQQSFMQMQQEAAQRGINITGTGFNDAVSNSTAGQKLIQNFQQNANIQNQNYQLGYLGQLGTNMGQLAGVGAQQAQTGMGLSGYAQQTPLGYVGQSISGGQGALAPMLQNYSQMLGSQYQPYYMQQIGPYMQQMAQQQANYQAAQNKYQGQQNMLGGIMNMGGQIGSAAMMA